MDCRAFLQKARNDAFFTFLGIHATTSLAGGGNPAFPISHQNDTLIQPNVKTKIVAKISRYAYSAV
jgi:hypothetical protein